MITPTRPRAASRPAPAALAAAFLTPATALISLGISLADDLGTPAFCVLIAAELLIVLGMGTLFGVARAATAAGGADAERLRRDQETLDALEPLRTEGAAGDRR
ncbi:hypothetical protein [Streptomyces sp. ISL-11]|uniref:hypothetical protein n=1 Tax=Streptomyces sp. ISL-11 TaxID=2819174 RepID=UPI001BE8057E|nr:hypothetical protein [Streptomyces sp. ISL-11]MBT2383427.1 hypothetical protein [Streptomyces sp. ISL-11]